MAESRNRQAAYLPQPEPVVRSGTFLPAAQIGVWIDPDRPKRYSMDTGFLPELA